MSITLLLNLTHWVGLAAATWCSYLIFRDIADITQFWLKVERRVVMSTWYRRKLYLGIALGGLATALITHLSYGAGFGIATWLLTAINTLFIVGGYFNPGWMMRTQQKTGVFETIEEAKSFIPRSQEVMVIEHNGLARAYTDYEIWRPHIVGTEDGHNGDNVVMTYCALTNLGMAVKPEIDGKPLELGVMTQLENNLVMWDKTTGEPIQQVHLRKECDGPDGPVMEEFPCFKMPFEHFARAYPDGEVFHRRRVLMKENPLVALYDKFWEAQFYMAMARQKQNVDPIFPTLKNSDERLATKEHVWGFNIGDDRVCYSAPFLKEHGAPINVVVGDQNIVAHFDPDYESVGIWHNNTGSPVTTLDFFGQSDQGKLERVANVKAGCFFAMWANFFPETDVNRIGRVQRETAA